MYFLVIFAKLWGGGDFLETIFFQINTHLIKRYYIKPIALKFKHNIYDLWVFKLICTKVVLYGCLLSMHSNGREMSSLKQWTVKIRNWRHDLNILDRFLPVPANRLPKAHKLWRHLRILTVQCTLLWSRHFPYVGAQQGKTTLLNNLG